MRLSADSYQTILSLRAAGVFQDIKTDQMSASRRFVAIACADGDRTPELMDFHRTCCGDRESLCFHAPARNGGGLVLAPSSPLANRRGLPHGLCCMDELIESCTIKDTRTVVLYGHFPCGAAAAYDIPVARALDYLVEAKDNVRDKIPGADVSLFVHVDYEGHNRERRFNTYSFNRAAYRSWKERAHAQPPEALAG